MLCSAISWKRRERMCVIILHAKNCIISHTTDYSYYPAAAKRSSVFCKQPALRYGSLLLNKNVLHFFKIQK
jgi:hypothetical protein